jgi:hypothetical protein
MILHLASAELRPRAVWSLCTAPFAFVAISVVRSLIVLRF